MPRKPRCYLKGVPCHVVQRGNNRQVCFYSDHDYRSYLGFLKEAADRYGCMVHAYVLMTNHVHLLVTPDGREGISRMMQSVGRRYVQLINHQYDRTGTLWEGRHKANLIDSEHYLLSCYRYIELNPVRAGMVESPADYRWSSYRTHAMGEENLIIKDHELYIRLGDAPLSRQLSYRELCRQRMEGELLDKIRETMKYGMPLGSERFRSKIERVLGRKLGHSKPGRPAHGKDEILMVRDQEVLL
jgi:putative transposase